MTITLDLLTGAMFLKDLGGFSWFPGHKVLELVPLSCCPSRRIVDSNPAGLEAWMPGCLDASGLGGWRLGSWSLGGWLACLLAGWQAWIGLLTGGWEVVVGLVVGLEDPLCSRTLDALGGRRIT